MKAFIISNKELLNVLHTSTESKEHQSLFKNLVQSTGVSLSDYMFSILTLYLMHYTPISEIDMSVEKHNAIYDRFSQAGKFLHYCYSDIRVVSHMDSAFNIGMADLYGKFSTSMYDDLYACLNDYYIETYGSRYVDRLQDQMIEELDKLAELIMHLANEIEARYLRHQDEETTSNVLFGTKAGNLIIFVN